MDVLPEFLALRAGGTGPEFRCPALTELLFWTRTDDLEEGWALEVLSQMDSALAYEPYQY